MGSALAQSHVLWRAQTPKARHSSHILGLFIVSQALKYTTATTQLLTEHIHMVSCPGCRSGQTECGDWGDQCVSTTDTSSGCCQDKKCCVGFLLFLFANSWESFLQWSLQLDVWSQGFRDVENSSNVGVRSHDSYRNISHGFQHVSLPEQDSLIATIRV